MADKEDSSLIQYRPPLIKFYPNLLQFHLREVESLHVVVYDNTPFIFLPRSVDIFWGMYASTRPPEEDTGSAKARQLKRRLENLIKRSAQLTREICLEIEEAEKEN